MKIIVSLVNADRRTNVTITMRRANLIEKVYDNHGIQGLINVRTFRDSNDMPYQKALLVASLFLIVFVMQVSASRADSEIKMLQYGTWGLVVNPDPFRNKYPVSIYVPPGTIIFDSKEGPLNGYISVQLH